MQLIYVIGDVHRDWEMLDIFISEEINTNELRELACKIKEEKNEDLEIILLQCGDFGIWIEEDKQGLEINNKVDFLKDGYVKIYFADGNHENHDILDELEFANKGKAFIEISPSIYFASFASILTLEDGTNIMFCGGAESADKVFRKEGKSWWPQEGVDENDMAKLPLVTENIDWIVSHAAPFSFDISEVLQRRPEKAFEQSRYLLDEILHKYKPDRWFFGHYHYRESGQTEIDKDNVCKWEAMDKSSRPETWFLSTKDLS